MIDSELTGAQLDAAVAHWEGVAGLVEKDGRMCHVRTWDPEGMAWRDSMKDWVMWIDYAPSQRWDHGGPLMEREQICVYDHQGDWWWDALKYTEHGTVYASGPTILIAAMRCYVKSKLGEVVPTEATPAKDRCS